MVTVVAKVATFVVKGSLSHLHYTRVGGVRQGAILEQVS